MDVKLTKNSSRNRIKPMDTSLSFLLPGFFSFFLGHRRQRFQGEGKNMRTHILFFLLAIICCVLKGTLGRRNHVVGSSLGWTVPPNQTFYQDWAHKNHFAVGEGLVFPYKVGVHNVIEVSKEDFENCTQFKVIERHHQGPLILELTKPGPHYYYCGVGLHCELGQKLAIDVSTKAPAVGTISTYSPVQDPSLSSSNAVPFAPPLAALLIYMLHFLFI